MEVHQHLVHHENRHRIHIYHHIRLDHRKDLETHLDVDDALRRILDRMAAYSCGWPVGAVPLAHKLDHRHLLPANLDLVGLHKGHLAQSISDADLAFQDHPNQSCFYQQNLVTELLPPQPLQQLHSMDSWENASEDPCHQEVDLYLLEIYFECVRRGDS